MQRVEHENTTAMAQLEAFEEKPKPTFDDFRQENGIVFWWASDMMHMLGYKDMKSFQGVLDKVTKALMSLGIPNHKNIIPFDREADGRKFEDFKLTRFACYLAAMNGSPSKPEVASAQAYFAQQTRAFEVYIQGSNEMDRLIIRDELKEGNNALARRAKSAGANDFAAFQDSGYRGLYNMASWQLKALRNLEKADSLFDIMGRTELAANLFRVTQTEERIKVKEVRGQRKLEETHFSVGKEVRDMVVKNTGKLPENLPQERQLPELKKELKQGYKKMLKEEKKV